MKTALTTLLSGAKAIIGGGQPSAVHAKGGRSNYVTNTDLEIQEYLRARLLALVPGSLFFSEEQENDPLSDGLTWVVDPLDGTMNYLRQRRCSFVSIALMEHKKPIVAGILNPYSNETFYAQTGKGAWLDDQPVRVSEVPLSDALVSIGTSPYRRCLAELGLEVAGRFLSQAADLRRTGSAAADLTDIACGRSDVFFELSLAPWDYAAGALLVTEAGGAIEMPCDPQIDFGKTTCVLASNRACRDEALRIMNAVPDLMARLQSEGWSHA